MPIGINKVSRNSQIGSDIPDSVVDSFEDGDLSEYSEYNNRTAGWTTTTNHAFDGSVSLFTNGAERSLVLSQQGDGLPIYPERGDDVTFRMKLLENTSCSFALFGSDAGFYEFKISANSFFGVDISIYKRSMNPKEQTLLVEDTSATPPQNEWLKGTIETTSSDLNFTVEDSSDSQIGNTLTATDTEYTTPAVGAYVIGSQDAVLDYILTT